MKEFEAIPDQEQPPVFAPSASTREAIYRAALKAAKPNGLLLRKGLLNHACPSSKYSMSGWWPRSPYHDNRPETDKGGPWSIETIAEMCELGLFTVLPGETSRCRPTKQGLDLIKPPKPIQKAPTGEKANV